MSSASHAIARRPLRGKLVRWALLGAALLYVSVLLIAPFAGIVLSALREGWDMIRTTFALADVRHAYQLTFVITIITVIVTTVLGLLTAVVLVRDRFRGRRFMNALV